jgi:tRNA (mo5U34)-methyltransferase
MNKAQAHLAATSDDGQEEINALGPWFHNLHLPDGRQTAPHHVLGDFPSFKWRSLAAAVPSDLSGWSVLDIGCNAGYYSIELAKRGAQVTGIDVEPLYLNQARWAVKQFGLQDRIEYREGNVYELLHAKQTYDLVWFCGVFYHLRYPVLALDLVRAVTRRLLMFQSLTMPGEEIYTPRADIALDERDLMLQRGWPTMAFIEHSMAQDSSNWWAPNHACVEALLRSAGFRSISRPEHEFYLCEPDRQAHPGSTDLQQIRRTAVHEEPA